MEIFSGDDNFLIISVDVFWLFVDAVHRHSGSNIRFDASVGAQLEINWCSLIFVDDFWFFVDAVKRRQGFMITVDACWFFGDAVQRLAGLNILSDDPWWLNLITF